MSGIHGKAQTNVYSWEHYLPALNTQFEKPPAQARDAHQPVDEPVTERCQPPRSQPTLPQRVAAQAGSYKPSKSHPW